MAADAYKNLEQRMDAAKEAEIAAYIMRDVELRQQNAEESGVLAYGRKPVPRGRPNERFLQNTLKSVGFANRKAVEDEMWEQWERHRRKGAGRQGSSPARKGHAGKSRAEAAADESSSSAHSESRSSGRSDASSPPGRSNGRDERSVDELLSQRAVRGRGASGSRADVIGPFLFPTSEEERLEDEAARYTARGSVGPVRPAWLPAVAEAAGHRLHGAAVPSSASLVSREAERLAKRERKEKKKAKKLKKEKKRRRKDQKEA